VIATQLPLAECSRQQRHCSQQQQPAPSVAAAVRCTPSRLRPNTLRVYTRTSTCSSLGRRLGSVSCSCCSRSRASQAGPHNGSSLHHVAQRGDDLCPAARLEATVWVDPDVLRAALEHPAVHKALDLLNQPVNVRHLVECSSSSSGIVHH
jgi:hypothetical protein